MDKHDAREIAARVIAIARQNANVYRGPGSAAFDYAVAGDNPHANQALNNAVYQVANEGYDVRTDPTIDDPFDLRHPGNARAAALADLIEGELAAYRARCKGRKYTGWSNASTGPIRYA